MKDPQKVIDQLSHSDALAILRILAGEDEQIGRRIVEMALDRRRGVDPEEVADVLYSELDRLEVEEVWERAGTKRHGYVDTGEAASQMMEEVMEPFLEDLRQHQELGMSVEALHVCQGLLQGLYRFERESTNEFKDWAGGAPVDFAAEVIEAWRKGKISPRAVRALKEFVDEELPGWSDSLSRELG